MNNVVLFENRKVGLQLLELRHSIVEPKKPSDPRVKMVALDVAVDPFTLELADALSFDVRKILFRFSDGEPVQGLGACRFKIKWPQQDVFVYPTPDSRSTRTLKRCDVKKVEARRFTNGTGWQLRFTIVFQCESKDLLAYLLDMLKQQFFAEFQVTDPTLLDGEESPNREADEREERLIRRIENDAQSEFAEARAHAIDELPLDGKSAGAGEGLDSSEHPASSLPEAARRPAPRHRDAASRARAKQKRNHRARSGRRR